MNSNDGTILGNYKVIKNARLRRQPNGFRQWVSDRPVIGTIIVGVALILFLIIGLWLMQPPKPTPMQHTFSAGDKGLATQVGDDEAIGIAQRYGLSVEAKLMTANPSPKTAREFLRKPTSLVRLTVDVFPGDVVTWQVDRDGKVVPGSGKYQEAHPRP